MARRTSVDDLVQAPKKRRKVRRWQAMLLLMAGGLFLLVLFLPQIVTNRSVLVPLVNSFAGIAPLHVDVEKTSAGWFAPIIVDGITLRDETGKTIAQVKRVETGKGIINWAMDSQNLGTIRVRGIEAAVETGDGTSNMEQLLEPLLASQPEDATSDNSTSGTIEILDSQFLLTERGRQEQWVVQLPKMLVTLPTADQVLGPIELQASLGEATGIVPNSVGQIVARVEQTGEAFALTAELSNIPADVWHVIRARMPELPVETLQGRVSGKVSGNFVTAENWDVTINQLVTNGLTMAAVSLLGPEPAHIESIAASGRASLDGKSLNVEGAKLLCDFGTASAQASLAWPLTIPTASHPFMDNSQYRVEGTVDLPKLILAAASLIPMRDETELQAGTAQFVLNQENAVGQAPNARVGLTLSGLRGVASGQRLEWSEPLTVELAANQSPTGLQLSAFANAEFAKLRGSGTITQGEVDGNVDLALLHQKISQWIELPIQSMRGTAGVQMAWRSTDASLVEFDGKLNTTPITLVSNVGGRMEEPAWQGIVSGAARLENSAPRFIERAKVDLTATGEQLIFDLREPLALSNASPAQQVVPPAFTLSLAGDMAKWKRRALAWLSEPPEFDVSGNVSLSVGGRLDLQHLEIQQASWKTKPIQVSTPQFGLVEPEMVGGFKGRVDTADLTRLQIESLQVQATSFSIGAVDSASEDGQGRVGRAKFLANLSPLLNNVSAGAGTNGQVAPANAASAQATTQMSATGQIDGDLAWRITSDAASFNVVANGKDVVVLSKPPGAIAATPLWQEPTVTSEIEGSWTAASGNVDLRNLKVRTDWCDYAGNLNYRTQTDSTSQVVSTGQATVNTAKLSTKLAPMTGNHVQMAGVQTVPVDVTWTSSTDPKSSALAGLQASTRIGWEQARVVGVDVGKADVPVTIDAGRLHTEAEIAVSGGTLRWNITSDLTAEEMVLVQQPMTVLENVAITQEMTKSWLKYVTPLVAEATTVNGRLSLALNQATLIPTNPRKQTVAGQLVMHSAEVGPGPLSNSIITFVKQIDAIRKKDFTQAVSNQTVWVRMPEQRIDFEMVDGRVIHRNLNVNVGDVTLSTSGSVDVSGQMDLLGSMPIPNDWADKSPLLAGLRGQTLQIPVRGSLTSPQLDGSILQQLGRQTVQGAAAGLLEKGLSRGFDKIFGGNGIAPLTPPVTTPQPQP